MLQPGWAYAYHVVEADGAGMPAVQVFLINADNGGQPAWALDFTERRDPTRRVVVRLKCDTDGIAVGGLGDLINAVAMRHPQTLERVAQLLTNLGIPEAESFIPYADPYDREI